MKQKYFSELQMGYADSTATVGFDSRLSEKGDPNKRIEEYPARNVKEPSADCHRNIIRLHTLQRAFRSKTLFHIDSDRYSPLPILYKN